MQNTSDVRIGLRRFVAGLVDDSRRIAVLAVTFLLLCTTTARAQTGACCQHNGLCFPQDEETCASTGSDFLGVGVPCVANLCRGGCCRPTGECSENIAKLNCEINGGSYLGHSSNCTGVECPVLPNGACCFENFCREGHTPPSCDGFYAGDDSTCDDCPGACCLTDESCIPSTLGECTAIIGASFGGNSTVCPPDGCGLGACCFATTLPGGECSGPIDPFNCERSGGLYSGHATDCATSTCPAFGGGCCCGAPCGGEAVAVDSNQASNSSASADAGGSCFVTTQQECATTGCQFLGEGVACGSFSSCPGAGACCPADGSPCYLASGRDCVCGAGVYRGEGTTCEAETCLGGACCIEGDGNYVCELVSGGSDCDGSDEVYLGDGTRCGSDTDCGKCMSNEDCDDFDPCNGSEICVDTGGLFGFCSAGVPPETDDGIDCTVDACNPATGAITHTPNHAACADGDPCNGAEQCDPAQGCVAGTSPTCDDSIDCTNDSCDTSHPDADPVTGCVNTKNDAKCDDGIDCTVNRCLALDTGSGCVFNPDATPCLDEDLCTTNERCDVVQGCLSDPVNCNDGVPCTIDTCDSQIGCLNGADNSQCNDGVSCTIDACRPNRPERDANGCVFDLADFLCDTTDLCLTPRCDPVADCQFDPRECPDDGDPCTREFCDSSTGECLQETICGACCRQGQPCIDGLTPAQCSGPDDTFMGLGTACATALCGACCDPESGACTDGVTDLACATAQKIFQGPGTNCIQDPCTGACCDPGFTGIDVPAPGCHSDKTAEECAAIDDDAIFVGVGTDCFTAPCGACCDPATSDRPQSCLDAATAEYCEALEYVYAGDQTTCINDPCRGACCLADGSCIVTTAEDCGGDFRGNGTDCLEIDPPCEPFTGGACCLAGGLCFDATTRETCVNSLFGVYLGDASTCGNAVCTEDTVRADFDGNGSVDLRDVKILFLFFGKQVAPGTSGDISGDGLVDETDWDRFFQVHIGPS